MNKLNKEEVYSSIRQLSEEQVGNYLREVFQVTEKYLYDNSQSLNEELIKIFEQLVNDAKDKRDKGYRRLNIPLPEITMSPKQRKLLKELEFYKRYHGKK
ncbi:hypothetical protein [Piscibacillus salipiscarius]|uniref:Uncharacterized protein n=1 Tax=Piscibacillus salipiscarius TaxID=299480 RepID=A0ABW5Q8D9_9BACI